MPEAVLHNTYSSLLSLKKKKKSWPIINLFFFLPPKHCNWISNYEKTSINFLLGKPGMCLQPGVQHVMSSPWARHVSVKTVNSLASSHVCTRTDRKCIPTCVYSRPHLKRRNATLVTVPLPWAAMLIWPHMLNSELQRRSEVPENGLGVCFCSTWRPEILSFDV